MSVIRSTQRRAIKAHRCSTCERPIAPGEQYVVGAVSPSRLYPHWQNLKACRECAERFVDTYGAQVFR